MNLGGVVACFFCDRDGGRTMFGKKWPKAPAVAPFLPEQRWPTNPACATHGTQLAVYSHLVKAPLAAVAHNLEAVENSDLLWSDMPRVVPPHHAPKEVASAAQPEASVAVVADGPRPLVETLTDILSLGRMTDCEVAALPSDEKPPPMTADEEADFDRGIRF